ncbi:hypothetical protein Cni_G25921 [Canna indica]|uniref:Uncharacterized protein n=1 Tax=Canna indica TaxID=4628 RepID=A0AAQ3L569_9LILI|nr:hypothetical protein Cni_G25921 [Canna indica]
METKTRDELYTSLAWDDFYEIDEDMAVILQLAMIDPEPESSYTHAFEESSPPVWDLSSDEDDLNEEQPAFLDMICSGPEPEPVPECPAPVWDTYSEDGRIRECDPENLQIPSVAEDNDERNSVAICSFLKGKEGIGFKNFEKSYNSTDELLPMGYGRSIEYVPAAELPHSLIMAAEETQCRIWRRLMEDKWKKKNSNLQSTEVFGQVIKKINDLLSLRATV